MAEDTQAGPGGRAARWSALLDRLATEGRLEVARTAELLGVSEATVRRDFAELADRQLVTRTHGGIVASAVAYELPYRYRSGQHDEARSSIAQVAAALPEAGGVVAFNGGTTTTAAARAFCARDDLGGGGTSIVTNALNIASEVVLRPHVRCVSLGGVARPESYELTGPLAAAALSQLWLDVAIIGVNAFSAHEGATCRLEDEAAIVAMMVERAQRVVVVATADKIGGRTLATICTADAVGDLVTTADADPHQLDALREHGVQVHLA